MWTAEWRTHAFSSFPPCSPAVYPFFIQQWYGQRGGERTPGGHLGLHILLSPKTIVYLISALVCALSSPLWIPWARRRICFSVSGAPLSSSRDAQDHTYSTPGLLFLPWSRRHPMGNEERKGEEGNNHVHHLSYLSFLSFLSPLCILEADARASCCVSHRDRSVGGGRSEKRGRRCSDQDRQAELHTCM